MEILNSGKQKSIAMKTAKSFAWLMRICIEDTNEEFD